MGVKYYKKKVRKLNRNVSKHRIRPEAAQVMPAHKKVDVVCPFGEENFFVRVQTIARDRHFHYETSLCPRPCLDVAWPSQRGSAGNNVISQCLRCRRTDANLNTKWKDS